MITYHLLRTVCPNCKHGLYRGSRIIGPSLVHCKKCDTNVSTNLTEWKNLSTGRKIWQVVRELFSPTFLGPDSGSLRIIMSFFLWMIAACPFIIIGLIPLMADPRHTSPNVLSEIWMTIWGILGLLFFPGLIVYRLVHIIKESNKFLETQQPPRW